MKPSVLHIVLSFLLLLSYGAERLLPCSGIWDVDCPTEQAEEADHASEGAGGHHDHSDDSESSSDHGDHQCNCPCHALALTSTMVVVVSEALHEGQHGSSTCSLPHTSLSPPDHIPIA